MAIQNQSTAPVYIRFQGPVKRDFLVQVGSTKVQLNQGRYNYQYTACGINFTGTIDTTKRSVLRIAPCKTTKIIVKNYTIKESPGASLTLQLTGPTNYYFFITKPAEKLTVQQGIYKYTLRGCGGVIDSGLIELNTAQYRWTVHCPQ